ncbi:MAG TPA: phosphoenolpyruvate carboxykinase (GTP) [Clostridia bacterium]|nr:phosphoenolpyruvate carboxykinase (GTP) [Clostridia bacterium]
MKKSVSDFVAFCADLMQPEKTVWIDGSKRQIDELNKTAVSTQEFVALNKEKLPNCFLHRSAPNDVARIESRTFICSRTKEQAGPTNNWMEPNEAYKLLSDISRGCMKGRTMYVIPYSMAPIGSPFAKYGIEVTDSIYVVTSMTIMTRVSNKILDVIGDDFVRGIHSKAELDAEKRYICQFPQDNTIWSVNSGYGGNVLLGKKCFALRIASNLARDEGWLAEHMLIVGITRPDGKKYYIAGAFPSACGKTNLAMLIPPKEYLERGYKVETIGDDIAWIRVGKDGALYAANPEYGFFGVAPGTNMKTNANAMLSCQKDSLLTNVALNPADDTVWWEGMSEAPETLIDWTGKPWHKGSETKAAHPNSRFTAPIVNCPCLSPEFENPQGVKLSAILFGGRREDTVPLVYEAKNWEHGVFVASVMASQTTAAAAGAVGVLRRDPFAMLPFCGYNMNDYFAHWLSIGKNLKNAPKIFNVNWFQKKNGRFLWPGFGDNMRVIDWIIDRCEGKEYGTQTPIGIVPKSSEINQEGLNISQEDLEQVLNVDKNLWENEVSDIERHYKKFGSKLPKELNKQLNELKQHLQ